MDGEDAIHLKIYKEGIICRYGVGGLPRIGISGMSHFNNSEFFVQLIDKVPQHVLDQPMLYEEETPNGYIEYSIAFFGISKNGIKGEHADWAEATGLNIKLDQQSSFKHPIMIFIDGLTMDAAELTNEWYFDIINQAMYKVLSSNLPKETIITVPKTEKEIRKDYENYIQQMLDSARGWTMKDFTKNKSYSKDGQAFKGIVTENDTSFNIKFVGDSITNFASAEKKRWWEFW